jgi:ABC-2 type transport system ATP-binding protein
VVDRPTHYGDLSGWANAFLFARAYGMEEEKANDILAELFDYFDLGEYAYDKAKTYSYGMEEEKANDVLAELFDYFDLGEYAHDKAKTYSFGMGKKLALIEAVAHDPELLLLDEPSLGLDYTSQLAFQRKVRELAGAGAAIVLASNQVDEVEALCDRVAFLHRGMMVAEGTPEELVSSLRGVKRVVATLRNPVGYGPVGEVAGVERVATEGRKLVVHCEDRPNLVADVVAAVVGAGGDITDLAVRRPNLEDVFVKLTGEALRPDEA